MQASKLRVEIYEQHVYTLCAHPSTVTVASSYEYDGTFTGMIEDLEGWYKYMVGTKYLIDNIILSKIKS